MACFTSQSTEKSLSPIAPVSVHAYTVPDTDSQLVGVAVSWSGRDAFFLSLMPAGYDSEPDADDTLAEPVLDAGLTAKERVDALDKVGLP